ncbi:MAG: methionine--tRNA ligase [Armatimonadota bacterium]
MPQRYYLTTPIYYVNDIPHIGTSYTTVAADILARFHRQRGEEVLFATGTDENAPKVAEAAAARGRDPQEFVDEMAGRFRQAWAELNVEHDVFIRTTEPRHKHAVSTFVKTLQERGDIYQGPYEGWYCISCETYFSPEEAPETEGERRCPNIPEHPPLRLVQETNYFFALTRYADRLLQHIEAHPEFLQPEFRRNEVVSFIQQGLRDVCISRGATGWGIPVPGDPSQVVYVWFDALINYITLIGYPDDRETFEKWWPADLHLVGKDIYVRFHCTLWPAMLMAAGLPLPRSVFGHGFWLSEGKKISKSLGNMIEPLKLSDWLAELSGASKPVAVDAIRYFLFREMPFGEDGNFTRQSLCGRFNGDLANDLGNALNRSLSLTLQNFGPVVPPPAETETRLAELARELHPRITTALERVELQAALIAIWQYVAEINRYLGDRAPWKLAKEGKREEVGGILYHALEGVRVVTTWLAPFMPRVAQEMQRQLGLERAPAWQQAEVWGYLQPGAAVEAPSPIFPRIDKKAMEEALKNVEPAPSADRCPTTTTQFPPAPASAVGAPPAGGDAAAEEASATIGIEDFIKVELRVAEVLSAERVPKADKLLHLRVSLGDEERTVLAGMAEYYEPETLVGRKVIMVANLAPRKMRGLVSQGMLLAAESEDGRVSLLQPDQDLPAGAKIR